MKAQPEKKYYTAKEAAEVLGGNERTFRRKAVEDPRGPMLITKCTDTHYRAPLKNWEKLLGLVTK
jgi:hypothetical protein